MLSFYILVDVSPYFFPDNLIDCLILKTNFYLSMTMFTDQMFCKKWASLHCVCELLSILSEGVG